MKIDTNLSTKICSDCHVEKQFDQFEFRADSQKYRNRCKECSKIYNKKYNQEHSNKRSTYRQTVKEEIKIYNQKYREENYDEIKEQKKIYREEHREERSKYNNEYQKERKKRDPIFKLRGYMSAAISTALNFSKNGSYSEYLSYTIEELKFHIESQFEPWMTWDNRGLYNPHTWDDDNSNTWTWQLDHIIPQSDLPYISMEDENFKKCWALENLRPLNARRNLLDGATRARHK